MGNGFGAATRVCRSAGGKWSRSRAATMRATILEWCDAAGGQLDQVVPIGQRQMMPLAGERAGATTLETRQSGDERREPCQQADGT